MRTQAELNIIKQQILDACLGKEMLTSQIGAIIGIHQTNTILDYCGSLSNQGYLRRKTIYLPPKNSKAYSFTTINPHFIPHRSNQSDSTDAHRWSDELCKLFGLVPIETSVEGRKIEVMNDYAKQMKDSDKSRRENKKSARVYVTGTTLHMAV